MSSTEAKLRELEEACQCHNDAKSHWVLWAVGRYINTGRAPLDFERKFQQTDKSRFEKIIDKCLAGDNSDDGIIKTFKKCIGYAD